MILSVAIRIATCLTKVWIVAALSLYSTSAFADEYQYTYPITGSTMQDLVDQINHNSESPSGAFGFTKLTTSLSWKSIENHDGVCSVKSSNFTYDISIYMPEWIDIHTAKQCLQDNWNLVWNEVQLHEEEHRRLYRLLNTNDINQRITAIEAQTSCENLKASVDAEMKLIFDANDKLHALFHATNTPPTLWGC